jgi:hypothetical protein
VYISELDATRPKLDLLWNAYVGARIVRNRQGIDLSLINKEIPVE